MWTYMRGLRGVDLTETKNLIRTQSRPFLINTRCLVTNGHLLNFTAMSFTCADVTSMIDLWIWGQELFCDVKESTFSFVHVMSSLALCNADIFSAPHTRETTFVNVVQNVGTSAWETRTNQPTSSQLSQTWILEWQWL